MNSKVSLITINLNNSEGLKKTFDSIFSQTFSDYEYIVIDGGSSDESLKIIDQNANRISYWISEKDNGIYSAMNKGIRAASGEYLLFLNSGDYLSSPDVLGSVFKDEQLQDILYGISLISREGKIIHKTPQPESLTFGFFYNQTIPHQATFIKKYLFDQYGLYNENYKIHSDYEFWIRNIILNNCSVKKTETVVSVYNLEGISGNIKNQTLSIKEISEIRRENIPPRILEDYSKIFDDIQNTQLLTWVKSKNILMKVLRLIHGLAYTFSGLRKKLSASKSEVRY